MIKIKLQIPRRWRSDEIINTTHPDNWEELTPSQFIALVRVMNGDISENDLLVEMLDIPERMIKKLDTYQRFRLGQILDFMQSKAPFNRFIIPEINQLKAPLPGLSDVTFGEFIHMDTFYANYMESNSPDDLIKLVSLIYVQYHKGETQRPVFSGKMDWHDAKKISENRREAIALNYGLIRTWLEQAYPEVFPAQKENSKKANAKQGNGWVDVYDSIVGDDIINSEKYFNKSCTEMLRYMNKQIVESRKRKK